MSDPFEDARSSGWGVFYGIVMAAVLLFGFVVWACSGFVGVS